MTKMRRCCAIAVLALAGNVSNLVVAGNASPNDSAQVKPLTSAQGYIYTTAMVNLNLTSTNTWSQPVGSQWGVGFMICPTNSSVNNTFSMNPTDAHDCICRSYQPACGGGVRPSCSNTGLNGGNGQPAIAVQPSGPPNIGANLPAMMCIVPVGVWLPSSVLANAGNNIPVPATVLGSSIYVTYNNGTIPTLQPSKSQSYFNVFTDGGNVSGGTNTAFTNKVIPGGVQKTTVVFPKCNFSKGVSCAGI